MLPKQPPRRPQLGFLYLPPYRVQGVSIAGEATAVQVPELDIGFDIGECPRAMLTSNLVALSHGHMDHIPRSSTTSPSAPSRAWARARSSATPTSPNRSTT